MSKPLLTMWIVEVTPRDVDESFTSPGKRPRTYVFDEKPSVDRDEMSINVRAGGRRIDFHAGAVFSIDVREIPTSELERRLR